MQCTKIKKTKRYIQFRKKAIKNKIFVGIKYIFTSYGQLNLYLLSPHWQIVE